MLEEELKKLQLKIFKKLIKYKIIHLVKRKGKQYYSLIQAGRNHKVYTFIERINQFEDIKSLFTEYKKQFRTDDEALWCLLRLDLPSNHLCPVCGNLCKFSRTGVIAEYTKTCSRLCARRFSINSGSLEKCKQTKLERYGDANYSNREKYKQTIKSTDSKERRKKTMLRRYGYVSPFSNSTTIEKVKETVLNKYGVDNISKLEEIKEKKKQTMIKNYGSIENAYKVRNQRSKETCLQKYGVENPQQVDEIKKRTEQTNLEKYGFTNPSKAQCTIDKIKDVINTKYGPDAYRQFAKKAQETMINKYGVTCAMAMPERKDDIIVKGLLTKVQNGTLAPHCSYKYLNIFFDSLDELYYFIWQKELGVDIKRNKKKLLKYNYKNEKHRYVPDFIINNDTYVEVKGTCFIDKDTGNLIPLFRNKDMTEEDMQKYREIESKKFQCMLDNHVKCVSRINVGVWTDDVLKAEEYVINKYGKDFMTKLNIEKR